MYREKHQIQAGKNVGCMKALSIMQLICGILVIGFLIAYHAHGTYYRFIPFGNYWGIAFVSMANGIIGLVGACNDKTNKCMMVAFLVLSIISAIMGSNMVFLGVTIIKVISALGGFSGGFNTWAVLFCLVFAIGLVQAVSACVAAGFGCSVVCCNTNTVEVVVITPSGPMTSIGQIA